MIVEIHVVYDLPLGINFRLKFMYHWYMSIGDSQTSLNTVLKLAEIFALLEFINLDLTKLHVHK